MKAKWILLAAAAFVLAGCDTPKVETYKFKPPQMPDTTPHPSDNKELEKQLRETMKLLECKEATAVNISLAGNMDAAKIKAPEDVKIPNAPAETPSFKTAEDRKPQLVQFGCPEELVKREAGEREVVELDKSHVAAAEKVLLCGKMPDSMFLIVSAETVVLKDFEFTTPGYGNISVKTGTLKLEGRNKLSAISVSTSLTPMNALEFRLNVESAVAGDGTLELESRAVPCKADSKS